MQDLSKRKKLAEGKTKIIFEVPSNPGKFVDLRAKPELTAGDGARKKDLKKKDEWSTQTTVNVFKLLREERVPNHLVERIDEVTFRACRCDMVPIEVVARKIATGSYLQRNPKAWEGTKLDDLVIELFLKDDEHHDPFLILDRNEIWRLFDAHRPIDIHNPLKYLSDGEITSQLGVIIRRKHVEMMKEVVGQVFRILETAWIRIEWKGLPIYLVDLKIEFGFHDGKLIVADVIDNDSWRLWPGGSKELQLDKQSFRELDEVTEEAMIPIAENLAWVADATEEFPEVMS